MTKKFNEFVSEANELTEDHKEQCLRYKQDAIEQCDQIKEILQDMINEGIVYYGAKNVSRQLEDVADMLENFKDHVDDNSEGGESGGSVY